VRAARRCQPRFQRAMSRGATLLQSFHQVRCEMLDVKCQNRSNL
jgi:hypothetical protein